MVLVGESLSEVEGEVGDGIGLGDGVLELGEGDGVLLLNVVDDGDKIISLCLLP